jgi:AraC-like DNA-binding protein
MAPKQMQRLFGPTGVTFSEFVLEQRLLLARRLLAHGSSGRDKIGTTLASAMFHNSYTSGPF